MGGREVVYNFSTFQRAGFTYIGYITGVSGGGTGTAYVGDVEGFVTQSPVNANSVDTFLGQYSGWFTTSNVGASPKLPVDLSASVGVMTAKNDDNSVRGTNVYFSAGISVGLDIAQSRTYYSPEGINQSYIGNDCKVDISALKKDIIRGAGSPHPQSDETGGLAKWRNAAANAAQKAAEYYNSHTYACGSSC